MSQTMVPPFEDPSPAAPVRPAPGLSDSSQPVSVDAVQVHTLASPDVRAPDARQVLAAVVDRRRCADRAEAELLALVVHFLDLHPVIGDVTPATATLANGGSRGWSATLPPVLVPVAGEGTPEVAEHAVAELGAALGLSYRGTLGLVGDTVELCFRLPRLWALVQGGQLQAWKARHAASATTTLPSSTAAYVDRHLAVTGRRNDIPGNLNPVIHEALLRWEPEIAEGREEAALADRDVAFDYGRSTASCATATMTATLDTLDAMGLDATISDLASAMGRLGDTSPLGVRRSHALGMLADPQHVLDVFSHEHPAQRATDTTCTTDGSDTTKATKTARSRRRLLDDPIRATTSTLYLHVTAGDLRSAAEGNGLGTSGRVEKLGAASLGLLRDWLARSQAVTVRPVLDLRRDDAVDGHEPTIAMRETVILRDRHCVFPGCRVDARSCDLDHIAAYVASERGGPQGQTSASALACLCRRHHRLKTFTGWRYERLAATGDYEWTSPSGEVYTGHRDPGR